MYGVQSGEMKLLCLIYVPFSPWAVIILCTRASYSCVWVVTNRRVLLLPVGQVYLPGDRDESDGELVFEPAAYKMYHSVSTPTFNIRVHPFGLFHIHAYTNEYFLL